LYFLWEKELDADRNITSCCLGQGEVLHDVAIVLAITFLVFQYLYKAIIIQIVSNLLVVLRPQSIRLAMHVHF
jgi:hypothetical protein